ncbi:MAG: preQ(1) synthase [Cyanobacteria bacterium J06635_15]
MINEPMISESVTSDTPVQAEPHPPETLKYGEREIQAGELITFPNPRLGRRYTITVTLPEFTCKCPFSGYPDFATIHIAYVPNERVVELKALKLYINSYRDRYISHEESVNQIVDDMVAACDPLDMTVKGDFSPRGNVHTVIEVRHQKPE